jgi:hypothetical protein
MSRIAFLYLTIDTPNKSIDYLIKKNSNIYIHPKNQIDKKYSKFIIDNVIETSWGSYSLVEASINLLKAAINTNDYFILCSGDCFLLRKEIKYEGLSCFDFVKKDDKYYKTSQWWILNKTDAITIINTQNKYKYLKNIKISGAIDEYYFLSVLMMENKNYTYNNFNYMYKRWFKFAITKHPVIFNKLTKYDIKNIKKVKPFFIRKVLPTFTITEYKTKKDLYVLLIGTELTNLDYFKDNNIDLIILTSLEMNKIDKVLLDKCICIYPIIFKFYYLSILDICSTNYLKQWSTVYFINETFDISKINKDSVLTKLPIDSKYNKKIFYKLDDDNYFIKN